MIAPSTKKRSGHARLIPRLRPTIINYFFPVLVREKYHAGGRLIFIILLKTIIISRVNATYTLGHINV